MATVVPRPGVRFPLLLGVFLQRFPALQLCQRFAATAAIALFNSQHQALAGIIRARRLIWGGGEERAQNG